MKENTKNPKQGQGKNAYDGFQCVVVCPLSKFNEANRRFSTFTRVGSMYIVR